MRLPLLPTLAGYILLLISTRLFAVLPPPTDAQMAAEEARIAALRDAAPEYLLLDISEVTEKNGSSWTSVRAEAVIVEVFRSESMHSVGDTVALSYCARWNDITAFQEELERKARDGYAGPGIEVMPVQPLRIAAGDEIRAWLTLSENGDRNLYIPAAGAFSFQRATSESLGRLPQQGGETNPVCSKHLSASPSSGTP